MGEQGACSEVCNERKWGMNMHMRESQVSNKRKWGNKVLVVRVLSKEEKWENSRK